MRVTNRMLYRTTLGDLEHIAERNSRLLTQMGTGRRLLRPSDNPADAVRYSRLRKDIQIQSDLVDTIHNGNEQLSAAELAMDDATSVFQRAKELAIQGASGARTASDYKAIEAEANQLIHDLASIGNRKVNNRYIFAGTATATQPFTLDADYTTAVSYNGNTDVRTVEPAPGVSIPTNIPGDQAFVTTGDAFNALIALRDAAAAGDVEALSGSVAAALDTAFNSFIDTRTSIGAATNGLDRAAANLEDTQLANKQLIDKIEAADLSEVLVELQLTENQRQAALQAAARVLQPTLLDFLA